MLFYSTKLGEPPNEHTHIPVSNLIFFLAFALAFLVNRLTVFILKVQLHPYGNNIIRT